ncbi:ubiquinone/menaquinone biosynthesis C-methyltransferase UbiE-like [Clytia hemisphaerica]|uniref:Methyltransferase domain-containing protein n=1 Tax=Clytia hemisphaerica TaxID=252671 RepID=A0A7M5X1E3_9CNID|eukprot:TCONS_00009196-protein
MSHSSAMEASKSAKLYQHKTEGVQKKYGIQLLEYLPVKHGDIIGEIGCGSGNLAAILARLVGEEGRIIALDPNMERIKVAKKEYGNLKNIKFISCKSVHLPILKQKCYDSFISNAVLHWIPTEEKIITFRRILSVLKPGGYFVGNISFNRSTNMQLATAMLTLEEQEEISGFYYRENPEKLKTLLLDAGFEIVEYKYRYSEINLGTVSSFLDWITATYYGKFDFKAAYKHVKNDIDFMRLPSGDVKHTSEGALFVCRKPLLIE